MSDETSKWEREFIQVVWLKESNSGKTDVYGVNSKNTNEPIGYISWYVPWRKYCYSPNANTIYDSGCLNEIGLVCKELTIKHRRKIPSIQDVENET